MQASILTLNRGRGDHLRRLMEGLSLQTVRPLELVVAWMGEEPSPDLREPGCPVRHIRVSGDPLPLARARNRAAEAAAGDLLVFLDVDCIPSPTTVASYRDAADAAPDALVLGEVLYLPAGGVGEGALDFAVLDRVGIPHPSKPRMPDYGIRRENDHGELWGLSFALAKRVWDRLGGMDERFHGYGGEETDFAARLAAAGVPAFWTAGARAYHQHHPVHVPPLHHFEPILRNARLFHEKHGRWCMDYWLGLFRDGGLIRWEPDRVALEVLRQPTPAEIAASRQDGSVRFS